MTIPSAATKVHLDSGTDDPRQARAELADLVDRFNTLRSHLGTSGITSGSSVLGIGTGLEASGGNLQVRTSALMPSGICLPWAGSGSIPSGWLLCDGSAVSRTTYAELFSAIGVTYGAGDGSTTFNIPDLRGRSVAGRDNMGGTAANRITSGGSGINGTTLGATGGSETHTLISAELPDPLTTGAATHSNALEPDTAAIRSSASGGAGTISNPGGGEAHNNMPPTLILNWIIRT